jgi:hypothetical protein
VAGDAQKSGVLARAVVVQRRRLDAGRRHATLDRFAIRPMRAALQRLDIEPGLGEDTGDQRGVLGLAIVRGASDCELVVAETELVGGAALDQRQGLQHLDGRARKDGPLDIAERGDHPAIGVEYGDRAAMRRFARPAAHRFDQNRIHHPRRCLMDSARLAHPLSSRVAT